MTRPNAVVQHGRILKMMVKPRIGFILWCLTFGGTGVAMGQAPPPPAESVEVPPVLHRQVSACESACRATNTLCTDVCARQLGEAIHFPDGREAFRECAAPCLATLAACIEACKLPEESVR